MPASAKSRSRGLFCLGCSFLALASVRYTRKELQHALLNHDPDSAVTYGVAANTPNKGPASLVPNVKMSNARQAIVCSYAKGRPA